MSTKSQQFKREQERAQSIKHSRERARALTPSGKHDEHEREKLETTSHNLSNAASRKASFALEDSDAERPSRKSTRKSSNRQKPDSQLKRRETRRVRSPQARSMAAK